MKWKEGNENRYRRETEGEKKGRQTMDFVRRHRLFSLKWEWEHAKWFICGRAAHQTQVGFVRASDVRAFFRMDKIPYWLKVRTWRWRSAHVYLFSYNKNRKDGGGGEEGKSAAGP